MTLVWALYGVVFAVCGVSIYTDVAAGRIRDRFTVPAIGVALALQFAIGGLATGPYCLLRSLLGLVVAAAIGFWVYNAGFMGGGCYKLIVAVGALLGWPGILWFFACATPPAIALMAFPSVRERSWHLRPMDEIDLPRERWWMSVAVGVGAACAVLAAVGVHA